MNQESIIRFGIIGAGNIARQFATGCVQVEGAKIVAVGARSLIRAKEFAEQFDINQAYGSYEELVQDPEVDVIYVSTPNSLHKEHSILAMSHGKHVICEKPFASNSKEVEEMIAVAHKKDVFLMEAMWTRYFPMVKQVKEWIRQGKIGQVKMLQGDFGFQGKTKDNIRYNLSLSGGALMDVGIYPVSFASYIYEKQPIKIKALADICDTGVDEQNSMIFQYEQEELALLSSAINTQTARNMHIMGEKGFIHIPNVWQAKSCSIHLHGEEIENYEVPFAGNGYNYEIEEVVACLRADKRESEQMPLEESLAIMRTMDKIRAEIGLVFPADGK